MPFELRPEPHPTLRPEGEYLQRAWSQSVYPIARQMGVLVMGNDLLSVDATCCRLMKLNPELIAYLSLGQVKRLGLLREIVPQITEIALLVNPKGTLSELQIGDGKAAAKALLFMRSAAAPRVAEA